MSEDQKKNYNQVETLHHLVAITENNNAIEPSLTYLENDSTLDTTEQIKMSSIRPNDKRAKIAQLFVWTVLGIEVLSIGSSYLQIILLESFQNGEEVTDLMINSNDTREQWMGISYTILFAISAFTFIQWFRRAYYNLGIRTRTNSGEGWAAGAWFVPFLNLIRPYRIMEELDRKTSHLINAKDTNFTKYNSSSITAWWILWIISNLAGRILTKASANLDTIDQLLYKTKIDIGLSGFMIILSIVTVIMIKDYAVKEEKLLELEKASN